MGFFSSSMSVPRAAEPEVECLFVGFKGQFKYKRDIRRTYFKFQSASAALQPINSMINLLMELKVVKQKLLAQVGYAM